MRCPTLSELPLPPAGKIGWPWTEESPQLPDAMPDGVPWPRVSIVTPSFNQAQFIEETIRSVLLQGYPDLEYIIIDGGSTDGSVEVIRKYEAWLAYWVSERDRGQSDAINKGWLQMTGAVTAWLNSDDTYRVSAVGEAIQALWSGPHAVVVGNACVIDELCAQTRIIETGSVTFRRLVAFWYSGSVPPQPAIFWRSALLETIGPLDIDLRYAMDYDLWLRMVRYVGFHSVPTVWANMRIHTSSKTGSEGQYFWREWHSVSRLHWHDDGLYFYLWLQWDYFRKHGRAYLVTELYEAIQRNDLRLARRLAPKAIMVNPQLLLNLGTWSSMIQMTIGRECYCQIRSQVRQLVTANTQSSRE